MSAIQAVSNARSQFECTVRQMGPGYAATINGVANPIRIVPAANRPLAQVPAPISYRHVIDTVA